ncbi:MAG: tRNA (N(6)-L-threonylcarbamoyladenosine(37)-C(2))-methylthiotransferase MtaB [Clostridium sp.]|nr:tRNA (N(6)-L-threonylcarbamoyladenosine(37)-C(2))-methylthiotransferase MtaB [Clostridium sp.]
MKKFILKTHGCKSNQLESAVIKEKLLEYGFEISTNIEEADYFILNSCSVTENADNEALRTVRHAKNKNENIITVLTGCCAQLNAEKLLNLPFIDIILGNNDKFEIVKAISEFKSSVNDIFEVSHFNNQPVHNYFNTRGYLKIQDGCNNYCSYCTIPLARGKSRSNTIDNIIKQIHDYTDSGIKEVVLTGIHIGQWGEDFDSKQSLKDLLSAIENTDIKRYRLGSLNTLEIDDELLNFLSSSKKFCPHFHLSLQSLNDNILKLMNRHYDAKSCLDLMEKIEKKFDLPFIGSDIIIGFPGETEEDFNKTLENVKISQLSNIHVFPYSIRKNTKAAEMSDQISEKEKQKRAAILHEEALKKINNFKEKNIGSLAEVLIEKRPDKRTNLLKGVTKNYLNVLINSHDKNLLNNIATVKLLNIEKDTGMLIAELV